MSYLYARSMGWNDDELDPPCATFALKVREPGSRHPKFGLLLSDRFLLLPHLNAEPCDTCDKIGLRRHHADLAT
jgi:hypothetical protein